MCEQRDPTNHLVTWFGWLYLQGTYVCVRSKCLWNPELFTYNYACLCTARECMSVPECEL